MPYVVAVNVLDAGVDRENLVAAVEKAWGSTSHPKNRRVSAVVLATVWNPLAATKRTPMIVLNPSAAYPLPEGKVPFPPLTGDLAW